MRFTVALCALVSTVPGWAQTGPVPGSYGPMHDWGWHGWWPLGGLIWLGLAIVGLVTVVRWLFRGTGTERRSSSSALAILEERYARGDINREEYEQRRRDLTV